MIERVMRVALVLPWVACASGFAFFSTVGMLTEAMYPPKNWRRS